VGWDRRCGALLAAWVLATTVVGCTTTSTSSNGSASAGSATEDRPAPLASSSTAASVHLSSLKRGEEVPGYDDEVALDRYAENGDVMALVEVSNGVATVRRSSDQGMTWTTVKLPDHTYLNTSSTWVRAVGNTFLVIGRTHAGTVVSRSSDGGQTWTSSTLPGSGRMLTGQDLDVAGDGRTAVILGRFFGSDDGVLLGGWRSSDDGRSWSLVPPQTMGTKPVVLDRVSMDDHAVRAWTTTIAPSRHQLLRSEDGGATWGKEVDPPATWPVAREDAQIGSTWWRMDVMPSVVAGVDPDVGGGNPEPRLLRSDDDGATWKAVAIGPVPCPEDAEDPFPRLSVPVQAGGLLTVVTSCTDGDSDPVHGLTTVWVSTDGGAHWTTVDTPKPANRVVPVFPVAGVSTNGEAWFPVDESPKAIVVEPSR